MSSSNDDLLKRIDDFKAGVDDATELLREFRHSAYELVEKGPLARVALPALPEHLTLSEAERERTAIGRLTPQADYLLPLAGALIANGGTASVPVAQVLVLRQMAHRFTARDLGRLKDGEIRWMNKVRWARNELRTRGHLRSVHGIWEITQAGRDWYENEMKRHA